MEYKAQAIKDGEIVAQISSYSLEGLEEQLHKLENIEKEIRNFIEEHRAGKGCHLTLCYSCDMEKQEMYQGIHYLLDKARQDTLNEVLEKMNKIWKTWGGYDDGNVVDVREVFAYNSALSDLEQLINDMKSEKEE